MYIAPQSALPSHRARRMSGVSLLELLVVISIVGILFGVAAASYKGITTSSRITGEINGLLGDMQYARSEAIKQGQSVIVCVSTTGTDCTPASSNWDQGWIVFVDTPTHVTGGNTALILRTQRPFTGGVTLTNSTTTSVTFDREGLALNLLTIVSGNSGAVLALHNSTNDATRTRCLQITNSGNVSVQTPSTLTSCT